MFEEVLFSGLKGRAGSSRDGRHLKEQPTFYRMLLKANLALASTGSGSRVDMGFLDSLPPADDSLMLDLAGHAMSSGLLRVLIAEILEQEGRWSEAVVFAQAELADEVRICTRTRTCSYDL